MHFIIPHNDCIYSLFNVITFNFLHMNTCNSLFHMRTCTSVHIKHAIHHSHDVIMQFPNHHSHAIHANIICNRVHSAIMRGSMYVNCSLVQQDVCSIHSYNTGITDSTENTGRSGRTERTGRTGCEFDSWQCRIYIWLDTKIVLKTKTESTGRTESYKCTEAHGSQRQRITVKDHREHIHLHEDTHFASKSHLPNATQGTTFLHVVSYAFGMHFPKQ